MVNFSNDTNLSTKTYIASIFQVLKPADRKKKLVEKKIIKRISLLKRNLIALITLNEHLVQR